MPFLDADNAIQVIRGASKTFELTVTHDDGTAYDLTAARVVLTIKLNRDATSPTIQKDSSAGAAQVEIAAPRTGVAKIKLVPADTQTLDLGLYPFDVWVIKGGDRLPVIPRSTFEVLEALTRIPL